MKILFYPTSLNMSYIIDACEIIKDKNKKIKFGFIYNRKENESKIEIENLKYLKKKKLSVSNFYLENKKKCQNIDEAYLEYFEKISKINIWKIISSDRVYGRVYINDIHSYRSIFSKKNSKEILLDFINIAKNLEKIFLKYKPNVIYISNGQSNIEASIMNSFAKFYNVKILVPEPSRFKNYFFFSPSIYIFNDKIKKYYLSKKNTDQNDYKTNTLYEEIKNKGVISSDRVANVKKISLLSQKNFFQKILGDTIYTVLKHTIFYFLFLFGIKFRHLKVLSYYNLIWSIKDEIFSRKILRFVLSLKCPDLNKKYIYLPLHLIPETSTLLMGNDFMNQAFLVELISKNIPSDCKLYVKEHPAMFTSHGRKVEFYKRLKLLPNVELVPIYVDGVKLIKNSKLVIVVDGSSGFEAMLMGKAVVTMKYFIYSFLGLSETNNNINNLYLDIKNAIKKNKAATQKILESKIKGLIKSIISTCYTLRKPDTFYYNEKNVSLKDQNICGEDLANAMMKELKIIKK